MSAGVLAREEVRAASPATFADYLELTKPRIAVLELVTVTMAAFTARWSVPDGWLLAWLLIGTTLVAAGASALNQWLEIGTDARMPRTADRPLPAGRIAPWQALAFGVATTLSGTILLTWKVNLLTAVFGLGTWFLYVVVYTPLKRVTPLNTVVGAVAGAMPILMGWAAVEGRFNLSAAALFMIVFLWQFPHFMAIAWLYRDDYARGGMRMATVVDPSGRRAGRLSFFAALALVPVSLLPSVVDSAGPAYFTWAALLGTVQLAFAAWFLVNQNERTARLLLRATLIYLPSLLLMLILGPFS
jgi:protoheme IX farnesyltransferase